MDADSADNERHRCGRRSRVVLTPRRWRQVGERNFTGDGGKNARSPGSAKEIVKTIAQEMPGVSGVTVVTCLRAFYFLHARLRVQRAPGVSCALCSQRQKALAQLGRIRPREGECTSMH